MVRINGFPVGPPKYQVGPHKFEAVLPGLCVGSVVCHFDFLLTYNIESGAEPTDTFQI